MKFHAYEIPGESFGQPGKQYEINLTFDNEMIDDSDYDRETGYGPYIIRTDNVDNVKFEVTESDPDGNPLRDTEQLKLDPQLFKSLLRYAMERAEVA